MDQPIVGRYCKKLFRSRSGLNGPERRCYGNYLYSSENLTHHGVVEFGISLAFAFRVRPLLDHSKERINMQLLNVNFCTCTILKHIHAVQSLALKFTGVVQIRCTSGQVRVQNLCKQIED